MGATALPKASVAAGALPPPLHPPMQNCGACLSQQEQSCSWASWRGVEKEALKLEVSRIRHVCGFESIVIDLKLKDLEALDLRSLWGLVWASENTKTGNSFRRVVLSFNFKRKGSKKSLNTFSWLVKPALQGRKGGDRNSAPKLCGSTRMLPVLGLEIDKGKESQHVSLF